MNAQPSWRSALKNGLVSLTQVHAVKLDAYITGPTSASLPSNSILICMVYNNFDSHDTITIIGIMLHSHSMMVGELLNPHTVGSSEDCRAARWT